MQETHEIRDGFIIKKGETDPAIFAAMESIKRSMLREAAERKAIREGRIPLMIPLMIPLFIPLMIPLFIPLMISLRG